MSTKLGQLGESDFLRMAARAGLTANGSRDEDGTGWDFFVEWPPCPSDTSHPLRRAPRPIQCLVQVKATEAKGRRISVSLKNWVRFCDAPLPCFFVVMEYGEEDLPEGVFVVHVGEEHWNLTIERVRSVNQCGSTKKPTMDLTWSEADRIAGPNGPALRDALEGHVGSFADYVRGKVDHKPPPETLALRGVDIVLPPSHTDPEALLVDFVLGLVPALELRGGRVARGSPSGSGGEQSNEIEGVRLEIAEIADHGHSGTLEFSSTKSPERLSVPAKLFLPDMKVVRDVAKEKLGVRYSAPLLDVVVYPMSSPPGRVSFRPHFPARGDLRPLTDLRQGAAIIGYIVRSQRSGGTVELQLTFDGKARGAIDITNHPIPQEAARWAEAATFAWTVARHFEVERELVIEAADLIPKADVLRFLASVYGPDSCWIRGSCIIDGKADLEETAFAFVATLGLGPHFIVSAVTVWGSATTRERMEGGTELSLESNDVRRFRDGVFATREEAGRFEDRAWADMESAYGEECNLILMREF